MSFDKTAFEKAVLLSAINNSDQKNMMSDDLLREFLGKYEREDIRKSLDHLHAMGLIEESTYRNGDGRYSVWAPVLTRSGEIAAEQLRGD